MNVDQKLNECQAKIEHDIKVGLADKCMTQQDLASAIGTNIWNVNRAIKGGGGKKLDHVREQIYEKLGIKP